MSADNDELHLPDLDGPSADFDEHTGPGHDDADPAEEEAAPVKKGPNKRRLVIIGGLLAAVAAGAIVLEPRFMHAPAAQEGQKVSLPPALQHAGHRSAPPVNMGGGPDSRGLDIQDPQGSVPPVAAPRQVPGQPAQFQQAPPQSPQFQSPQGQQFQSPPQSPPQPPPAQPPQFQSPQAFAPQGGLQGQPMRQQSGGTVQGGLQGLGATVQAMPATPAPAAPQAQPAVASGMALSDVMSNLQQLNTKLSDMDHHLDSSFDTVNDQIRSTKSELLQHIAETDQRVDEIDQRVSDISKRVEVLESHGLHVEEVAHAPEAAKPAPGHHVRPPARHKVVRVVQDAAPPSADAAQTVDVSDYHLNGFTGNVVTVSTGAGSNKRYYQWSMNSTVPGVGHVSGVIVDKGKWELVTDAGNIAQ